MPWWKANADEFPTLSRMARDILSIPLTSVSVERVFSSARDVIPYRRNRLSPTMIEELLIAKGWLQKGIPEREEGVDINVDNNVDNEPADFADIENNMIRGLDIRDSEFLHRMVPDLHDTEDNDTRESDLESDGDISDLEHGAAAGQTRDLFNELRPSPKTPRKCKLAPIITTPLSGRLHKHVKRNYRV